jgi:hypothetical protein
MRQSNENFYRVFHVVPLSGRSAFSPFHRCKRIADTIVQSTPNRAIDAYKEVQHDWLVRQDESAHSPNRTSLTGGSACMADPIPIVFIVDDDISVRESLAAPIADAGWFASAQEFLVHRPALS